jgi:hypothetical protein
MRPVRGKRTWQGPVVSGKDRRGLVVEWGLAMLHPVLSASAESVDELVPCTAETKTIFPVHVARV